MAESLSAFFLDDEPDSDTDTAQRLIDEHNSQLGIDMKDSSYYIIGVTGRLGKYYTLYLFSKPIAEFGKCNPFLYKGNLSQRLLEAVRKVVESGVQLPITLMPMDEILSKIQRYGSQFFHGGKYQGKSFEDVYAEDPKYILWYYQKLEEESKTAKRRPYGNGYYYLTKKQEEIFNALKPFVETYHEEQIRTRRETIDSVHIEGGVVNNIEAKIIRKPKVKEGTYGPYVEVRCQAGNQYFILYAKPQSFPDVNNIESMVGATVQFQSAQTEPTEIYGVKYNKLRRVKGLKITPSAAEAI